MACRIRKIRGHPFEKAAGFGYPGGVGEDLPLVSGVLQHGNVLQWAAIVADRKLTLCNVPPDAGNPQWLRATFTLTQNSDGLRLKP